MPVKLILIRHGVTNWNLKKRYCGSVDLALNQKGREQARRLSRRLKGEQFDKLYSSDKKRAMQTAKIVFPGRKIQINPALREMHFGCFEGLTYKEAMKRYPEVYQKWITHPFSTVIPRGESLKNFRKRVVRAMKTIVFANRDKTVGMICHGGTIGILISHILKSKGFWQHIPASASITEVEYKIGSAAITRFNDTSHL